MTGERVVRRLAAILAADVVGYSRLMGRDENGTLTALKAHRTERLEPVLARHGGRLVKLTGDGALAEFPSAVDAVGAAIEFQQAMADANKDQPEDTALVFRIGLHLGDLIVDGDDLYGDGVNVAARLEAEAPPGGIVISRAVREAVDGRLKAKLHALGELSLKNIERPIRAFRVEWDAVDWKVTVAPVAPAPVSAQEPTTPALATPALALPDKPSIAVLPFQNMSGDLEQEYFSDGIADDIITELSRSHSLFVIARNSSFTYKGRAVDIKQVARELGVRYVLEGSVRRSSNRVRVTAQLIDAETGSHIWAERYDRDIEDVFAVQDEITMSVVRAVQPVVADVEMRRVLRKPPENLGAWEAYQRGLWHATRLDKNENQRSRIFFQQSITLDPTFSLPHQGLARTYLDDVSHHFALSAADGFKIASPLALRAVELDPSDANAHGLLGYVWLINGDLGEGLARADLALGLNINSVVALQTKGSCLILLGQYEDGTRILQEYLRLNPRDPWSFRAYVHLSVAHYALRQYEACIQAGQRSVQANTHSNGGYRWVAAALAQLDRIHEAQGIIRRASDVLAPVSFDNYALNRGPWLPKHVHEQMLDGLRKAGWHG